jgi:hypothetical protein
MDPRIHRAMSGLGTLVACLLLAAAPAARAQNPVRVRSWIRGR